MFLSARCVLETRWKTVVGLSAGWIRATTRTTKHQHNEGFLVCLEKWLSTPPSALCTAASQEVMTSANSPLCLKLKWMRGAPCNFPHSWHFSPVWLFHEDGLNFPTVTHGSSYTEKLFAQNKFNRIANFGWIAFLLQWNFNLFLVQIKAELRENSLLLMILFFPQRSCGRKPSEFTMSHAHPEMLKHLCTLKARNRQLLIIVNAI